MEALKLSKAGAMIMSKIDTKVMSGPLVAQERWGNDITYARAGFVSPSENEKSFSSKCANGCILLVHYFTKASNRAGRNSFTPNFHARWNLPLTKSELLLSCCFFSCWLHNIHILTLGRPAKEARLTSKIVKK